ncbi:MAG: ABC transporter permease [Candidatus Omnitrophica bacterium]|nr:ABC transporter permease [Candidatus Omnitrophota bacterium]MDD5429300.1 ABC transporter permease [Candidatus Omnitrophota bacterium]
MVPRQEKKAENLFEILRELFKYRELLFKLTTRGIKVQYKQTFLGIVWAIFIPFTSMIIFAFIHKAKIITIDTGSIPYPIFVYCGLLPWIFFAGSLNASTQSLVNYASLIDKIYFPRAIIPLASVLSKVIDLVIASIFLIVLMVIYNIELHIAILAVPLILFIQIIFVSGLALFLSMGNLFYRDIGYIVSGIVPLMMFVTPVIYPIQMGSKQLQGVMVGLNPMIPIINAYRDLILRGRLPNFTELAIAVSLCFCLFFISLFWFHKKEHLFAENI